MISITKNNDGTLLVIGKDNVIYTQRDINSPQVSTGLGSVIQGFQTKDELYIFLGTDLRLYFKTSLEDKLLDPYEVMDFNCRFLKDSNMLNYIEDDESDVYTKNNTPMKKMKVCSYKKEKCQAQWPPPGEDDPKSEDYIYHEYKSNILGPNKGACVLRDSRMRQYCESDEVKNKYPEQMRNKTYDIESGSCLINEIYCKNRGVDYVYNNDINEYDCNTSVGQDVLEFIFGTNTTRAVQAGINKGSNAIRRLLSGEATEINCPQNTTRVADQCYQNKPVNWPGGETIAHLQHNTIYSTVGADTSKSIPMSCDPGQELHAGLCYKNPDPNIYQYSSPGFYKPKSCPPGSSWNGTSCWRFPDSFGRGAGYPWKFGDNWRNLEDARNRCSSSEGVPCEQNGAIMYPNCQSLANNWGRNGVYTNDGCCICSRAFSDQGKVYGYGLQSVIGTLPSQCNSSDRELIVRLCYPKCPDGYERTAGNLEMCQTKCPSSFKNIGIGGCEKPVGYRYNVGVCPITHPYRLEALCYVNESVAI